MNGAENREKFNIPVKQKMGRSPISPEGILRGRPN
jgi:hypothetical protein